MCAMCMALFALSASAPWGFRSRCVPASIATTSSCIGFLKPIWEAARYRTAHFAAMIKKNIARSCEDIERALKFSIPILLSPLSHAYFDVPYAEPSADPRQEERRLGVGQRVYAPKTIAETFDWDPAEALGPNAPLANLAGVGSAIWGETIKDFTDLTFMLLPRLAGIAEKGWSDPQVSSWADHRARLAAHGRLWSQDGLTYFKSSTVDWEPERSL